MANVRIKDLVKRFDNVMAVKRVSVDIREGSLTAILGPSGCGKTTLLRCISGLLMNDEGQILIGEKDAGKCALFVNFPADRLNVSSSPVRWLPPPTFCCSMNP